MIVDYLQYDINIAKSFENLLDSPPPKGRQKEQVIQDFLEDNSELMPMNNLLNHHLLHRVVISKYPLGTALITDYAYLTKSSDHYLITFVELECPDKIIFTKDTKNATASSQFNKALNQVQSWQAFCRKNSQIAINGLKNLLVSDVDMPIKFEFQLIIGRSENKNLTKSRKELFQELGKGIDILTYDQVLQYYEKNIPFKKNIISLRKDGFIFKNNPILSSQIFSHLRPGALFLSTEQKEQLKKDGYELEKWEKGELLCVNGKRAASSIGLILGKNDV